MPGKKWVTKLSSAGLVYVHFGREIIREVLDQDEQKKDDKLVEMIFDKVSVDLGEKRHFCMKLFGGLFIYSRRFEL